MRQILLLLLAVVASLSALCQTVDGNYTPIVREGSEWVYYSSVQYNGDKVYKYRIEGDTTVNGLEYKKLMRIGHYSITDENGWLSPYITTTHCLLREDNKRIFGSPVETSPYINKLRGEIFNEETGEDFLYDFNDIEKFYKDWMEHYNVHTENPFIFETTDTCLLVDRKCYDIRYTIRHRVIEGIGGFNSKDGNDLVRRVWRLSGGASGHNLVLMKNAAGEYEYFNKDLYNKMLKAQHDVNNDGTVDVTDLNIVVNDVLGKEQGKHYYVFGSITEDNDFDVEDINSVVNYILGEIKSPLEK